MFVQPHKRFLCQDASGRWLSTNSQETSERADKQDQQIFLGRRYSQRLLIDNSAAGRSHSGDSHRSTTSICQLGSYALAHLNMKPLLRRHLVWKWADFSPHTQRVNRQPVATINWFRRAAPQNLICMRMWQINMLQPQESGTCRRNRYCFMSFISIILFSGYKQSGTRWRNRLKVGTAFLENVGSY